MCVGVCIGVLAIKLQLEGTAVNMKSAGNLDIYARFSHKWN